MSINLADLSDAELGALIRNSLYESEIAKIVERADGNTKKIEKAAREARKVLDQERAERSSLDLSGFKSGTHKVPDLVVSDVGLDELATPTTTVHYYRILASKGRPVPEPETMTWRLLRDLHEELRGEASEKPDPDAEVESKISTLMRVAGITRKEAKKRIKKIARSEGA